MKYRAATFLNEEQNIIELERLIKNITDRVDVWDEGNERGAFISWLLVLLQRDLKDIIRGEIK